MTARLPILASLCLPLGLASGLLGPTPLMMAQPASAHVSTSRWNNLGLSLHVSGGALSVNALVRATVTLTNESSQIQQVQYGGCLQAHGALAAEVLREDGTAAPILGVTTPLTNCGPMPASVPLQPGQHIVRQMYLVLTGDVVRGSVGIAAYGTQHLLTATLRLQLGHEAPPTIRLHTAPPTYASLEPSTVVRGPLLSLSWTRCVQKGIVAPIGTVRPTAWRATPAHTLAPIGNTYCPTWEWHAVAGWLNHPVAVINYKGEQLPSR